MRREVLSDLRSFDVVLTTYEYVPRTAAVHAAAPYVPNTTRLAGT